MKNLNYIREVEKNVSVNEGERVLERFLVEVYLEGPISNKLLSRTLMIPIPLITAIKKEYKKLGLIKQDKGMQLTDIGKVYVENQLGFKHLKTGLYKALKSGMYSAEQIFENEALIIKGIFDNRPVVDVTIDQAHCTYETSLKRSLLSLEHQTLIHKKILCIGDDDLVSLSLGFLLRKLYKDRIYGQTEIHVIDVDERLLNYIERVAEEYELPIKCFKRDFRKPLEELFRGQYDCFYTDPPYTLEGMSLFISRGVCALKEKKGLPIFFSYGHKSYDETHLVMKKLCDYGLSIHQVLPQYNQYEGASILGNIGQMMILHTTSHASSDGGEHKGQLYTRDFRVQRGVKSCSTKKH